MAVLKKINFGNGSHDIAKTIVQGKPEGVISVTNTSGFNNTDSEEKNYSYDIDVNVDGETIVKDGETTKSLKVGTVPAAQVSVAAIQGIDATNAQAAFQELKGEIDAVGGAAKSYKIVAVDEPASTSQAEYKIQEKIGDGSWGDVANSSTIVVPKDNAFVTAQLGHTGATVNQETGVITDGAATGAEVLLIEYKNGEGVYTLVEIPVGDFLRQSEFKDGLQVNNSGEVSAKLGQGLEFGGESGENQSIKVKVDSDSEGFLTVGANGVKISGVQNAIDTAIEALDVTDAEVTGKYVSQVSETDGKISVARQDVSGAKLNNYAKGSDETAVAATDTINQAFSKIEVRIDNNENTTAAALNDLNGKIDGVDTDLTAEETRAKAAESEIAGKVGLTGTEGSLVFTPTTNYGGAGTASAATSVMDNMQKIDTALKAVSVKADAIQYKVNGTTLEFFGMTAHA